MTRLIAREVKFGVREQVIAEGRAYGTLSRERHLPPEIFAKELKMMIGRWRHAGINGNSATAGEQAAHAAYRGKAFRQAELGTPLGDDEIVSQGAFEAATWGVALD